VHRLCYLLLLILLTNVVLFRNTPAQSVPPDNAIELFALRALREARTGQRIPLPTVLLQTVSASLAGKAPSCTSLHQNLLDVYRLPFSTGLLDAYAVLGHGLCYCSNEGNCKLWIFSLHKGKYEKLLEADWVLRFGFVRSRSALPNLVIWTQCASMQRGARVFKFDGTDYEEAGRWIEDYYYEDEDGRTRFHERPAILSYFSFGESLPD
jgi:hypothetical protein